MSRKQIALTEALSDYALAHSLLETAEQAALREETARMPNAGMQIAPLQGKLLRLLVELTGTRRALEVGTFTGYSALSIALSLPVDGQLVCCDISEDYVAVGRPYWQRAGIAEKIETRIGPAQQTMQAMIDAGETGRYDFLFIDADKANYPTYYEQGLQLLRQGGLLICDNVLWSGAVVDPARDDADTRAIRTLNDAIAEDARVTACLLPLFDGITLARKR